MLLLLVNEKRFEFDVIRGILILGVVLYHLLYDLQFFVGANINVLEYPILLLQRISAGGLLALFGMTTGIIGADKNKTKKRFLKLLLLAGLISIGSYIYDKDNFIYFGILHLMAVSSLLGLLFLRLENWLVLVLSVLAFLISKIIPEIFYRPSLDYFPLLPWFEYVLFGIYLQKIEILKNISFAENKITKFLALCGRHSMAIYLGHQVVLIGVIKYYF